MKSKQRDNRCLLVSSLVVLQLGAWLGAADDPAVIDARMRKDITFLASDECEGRGVGTKGIGLAADYIAGEFRKAGLSAAGTDGSYFQPFALTAPPRPGRPNSMNLRGPLGQQIEVKIARHFRPMGLSDSGKVNASIVFVGYGATAPKIDYDDYAGTDVAGKVVLIIRRTPRYDNPFAPFDDKRMDEHASLATKIANAQKHHAAAVLLVSDRTQARSRDELMEFGDTAIGMEPARIPVVHIRRDLGDMMLQACQGVTLRDIELDIERDLKPRSAPLTGWTVNLEVTVRRPTKISEKNVVGVLEGKGPLASQTVILGAHYDHLGYGEVSSMARGLESPAIHHGADDNGSGTTTLIELARRLGRQKNSEGRRIVFIAFSGEEINLLGSDHYAKHPLFPLDDTVAMINMDMVGRLRRDPETMQDRLLIEGTGTAKSFDQLLDTVNQKFGFKVQKEPGGIGPSDHTSFYRKKVPVFFIWTGNHADYHRPSDTADKINVAGMRRIADFVEELSTELAKAPQRPEYVLIKSTMPTGGYRGPRLQFMPGYGEVGDGVYVSAVTEGGAAYRGGVRDGDWIVEIAGKPIKNMAGYMTVLGSLRRGQPVAVTILRKEKRISLTVTPE